LTENVQNVFKDSFLERVLSQDLSTFYDWSKVWNINFNSSKTAVMTIYNQRNVHPLYVALLFSFQKPIPCTMHMNICVYFFITVSLGTFTFIRK